MGEDAGGVRLLCSRVTLAKWLYLSLALCEVGVVTAPCCWVLEEVGDVRCAPRNAHAQCSLAIITITVIVV